MRVLLGACAVVLLAELTGVSLAADPPPIQTVTIGEGRVFRVNGEPLFPIMVWLQDPGNFQAVKDCGMNTTAGYWTGSGGTKNAAEYLDLVRKAGLYGVLPFDPALKGRPNLLGYIHGDEPDLPHQVNDAEVAAASDLRVNKSTPLWKIVDGVTHSWSVLDPMDGASIAIRLKEPVTVERLAVYLTISSGLAVAKEVTFEADGRKILDATLEAKKGQQVLPLSEPATFKELKMTVRSSYPGKQDWGSISEIEGFDASGKNVLLSPPRNEPRALPKDVQAEYEAIRKADPSRPVFMTLTGNFHPHFGKWTDQQRASLYPAYIKAADVVGYDIYPIYGWNKPEWIYLVHDATALLVKLAGPRPVYSWIETSKGGQWTGALENQKPVTPQDIRAEVWMSICGGATAIGYFTHVWKPSYSQFGVPDENRKALRQINDQITRLAPAILGDRPPSAVKLEGAGDVKLAVMARKHAGRLYVFAVNYDERKVAASPTIQIEGLPAGSQVEVVDEDRTLRSEAGSFADTFEPLAVHVYSVPWSK